MYKIKIASIGKTKEEWLETAIAEYLKRLQHRVMVEFFWFKNEEQLLNFAKKEGRVTCLDSHGDLQTSEQFSSFLFKELESNGSKAIFIIGGPEGLPAELKKEARLVSFSRMTFTHQIIRLVLIEQVYRAFEIDKGSSYHK